MTGNDIVQIVFYLGVLLILAKPLGIYMARVYEGRPIGLDRVFGSLERLFYRICGIKSEEEMGWKKQGHYPPPTFEGSMGSRTCE